MEMHTVQTGIEILHMGLGIEECELYIPEDMDAAQKVAKAVVVIDNCYVVPRQRCVYAELSLLLEPLAWQAGSPSN